MDDQVTPVAERVIRPSTGFTRLNLGTLWQSRELLWFLAWRDILVRYKQTYLGVAWAVAQPFLTTVVFTVIFGRLANLPSEGAPYAVMTLAALLPWQFFANAMTESSNSILASSGMITKVYFPRLILPASAVLSGTPDFVIGLVMLLIMMAWYGVPFTLSLLAIPFFAVLAGLSALAAGLWLSALNVRYRDVRYIVPFLTRVGLYVTPVAFSTQWLQSKVSPASFLGYSLNPLVGIIDGFRWCVLGSSFEPGWMSLSIGIAVMLVLLVSGAYYFRTVERTFADII